MNRIVLKMLACSPLFVACGSGDETGATGSLSVRLEAEDTIIEGLSPGSGEEDIRDGWGVTFDAYVMAIGDVAIKDAQSGDTTERDRGRFIVDLTRVPAAGETLWSIDDLDVGRWTFGYAIGYTSDVERHDSVDADTFDDFGERELTYLVRGTLTKADGVSCPPPTLAETGDATPDDSNGGGVDCYANPSIDFDIAVAAATDFGPCERDGTEGFVVTENQTRTVSATIHGDHLFFNGFPEAEESAVLRLAQWLADCDLDLDGLVTIDELGRVHPDDLWELDADRYQLGGSPITPLDTMLDYVTAQLKTQGHFQGEGECGIDGEDHDH